MSADNGIFMILDQEENACVLNTTLSYLYEFFHFAEEPYWIGAGKWREVYELTAGHTIYKDIRKAVKHAVSLFKGLEVCEYGIVIIPFDMSFAQAKTRYLENTVENIRHMDATWQQLQALEKLVTLDIFKDVLLYPDDMDFTTIYGRVDNCYHVLNEEKNEKWCMEAENWLRFNELLL